MDAEALAGLLREAATQDRATVKVKYRNTPSFWEVNEGESRISAVKACDGGVRVETEDRNGPYDVTVIDPAEVALVTWGQRKDDEDEGEPDPPNRGAYL